MTYQLALQQLTDSALPTGAFAHSLGFESYIERGLVHDEESFGVWLAAFVGQQLTYSDALAIRFLYEGVPVAELDALLTAQLLPRQLREASIKMGGRLLEIGAEIFPSAELAEYRELVSSGRAAGHQPLAFAVDRPFPGCPAARGPRRLPVRRGDLVDPERRPGDPAGPERRPADPAEGGRRRRCRGRAGQPPHA